jgi:hypothetical protein
MRRPPPRRRLAGSIYFCAEFHWTQQPRRCGEPFALGVVCQNSGARSGLVVVGVVGLDSGVFPGLAGENVAVHASAGLCVFVSAPKTFRSRYYESLPSRILYPPPPHPGEVLVA